MSLGAVVIREKEFALNPAQTGPQPGVVIHCEDNPLLIIPNPVKIGRVTIEEGAGRIILRDAAFKIEVLNKDFVKALPGLRETLNNSPLALAGSATFAACGIMPTHRSKTKIKEQ